MNKMVKKKLLKKVTTGELKKLAMGEPKKLVTVVVRRKIMNIQFNSINSI